MATTSDILIGSGDIKFGDDDTATQIARLFIDSNAATAPANTLNIEGSTGQLANILGIVAAPTDITAVTSKKYVDDQISAIPSATPGGANTQIQFNNAGAFGGSANLTWDGATLSITGLISLVGTLQCVNGDINVNTGDLLVNGNITAGGDFVIGNGSNPTTIKNGVNPAVQDIILPVNSSATAGDVLTITNTATGTTSWATNAGGDVVGPASSVANSIPTFSGITGKLLADASGITVTTAGQLVAATSLTANTGDITTSAGNLVVSSATAEVQSNKINLRSSGGNNTLITSAASVPNVAFNLPGVVGSSGSFLKTDGSGNLSWGVPTGLQFSDNVKAAEAPGGSNIVLAPAPASIDGYVLVNGDLVLLMAQTNAIENGIYQFNGTNLVRPAAPSIYQTGGDVSDAVTFVTDGVGKNKSYVQTASPAVVGTNSLAYSIFAAQAEAQGPADAIQFANPIGVFDGSQDFTWNGSVLDVTGSIQSTGNITSTAGSIIANTSLIVGSTNATTITSAGSTTQNFVIPNMTGAAPGFILSLIDNTAGTTQWLDIQTAVPPAGANTQVQFNNSGVFGASSEFIWNDTTKNLGVTGTVTASGRITALEVKTTSDATLKTNIAPLHDPLKKIKQIEGYRYNWKNKIDGPEIFGVLAQQLEEVGLQNLVSQTNLGHKCVDYNQLIPLLLEGMKQMSREIEELKTKK
jgi:hypothetical protein